MKAGWIFAAVIACGLAAPTAGHADAPVFQWSGFYVGAHAGYGWSDNDYWSQYEADPANSAGANGSGALGGVHAGVNWQANNILFGIEGEFSASGIDAGTYVNADLSYRSSNRWLGTATVRVGTVLDRLLVYVKGGAAFTGASMTAIVEDEWLRGRSTATGWTAGVGFEYAFAPNWSAGFEYAHLNFGDESYSSFFTPGPGTVHYRLSETKNVVKFRLNYRFGAPPPP